MKRTPSGKREKTYRTLAIIGNGFDIAHNYATLYRPFVDATSSESLDIFKEYCDKDQSITTWYSFEENINRLTQELFQQSYSDDHDYRMVRQDRSRLQKVFSDIHNLLIGYLRHETESKPVVKFPSVKKYLRKRLK